MCFRGLRFGFRVSGWVWGFGNEFMELFQWNWARGIGAACFFYI